MMDTETYQKWGDVIEPVARSTSYDFPDISKEDIAQSLWVFILTVGSLDPDDDKIPGLLAKVAQREAWDERKQHLSITSQYAYRTSDLRRILETQFDYRDWDRTFVPDDARSFRGNDRIELSAELAWGLKKLEDRHPEYYDAIVSRYRDLIVPHNASSERKKLNRAIDMLAEILNWYQRPEGAFVGTRKAVSNRTAQYQIERGWDE